MLSEGQFGTDTEITLHEIIKECFRYCKIIEPNNNEYSLIGYANQLNQRYIIEQVQKFLNTQRVIDFCIITVYELFQHIFFYYELPIFVKSIL